MCCLPKATRDSCTEWQQICGVITTFSAEEYQKFMCRVFNVETIEQIAPVKLSAMPNSDIHNTKSYKFFTTPKAEDENTPPVAQGGGGRVVEIKKDDNKDHSPSKR